MNQDECFSNEPAYFGKLAFSTFIERKMLTFLIIGLSNIFLKRDLPIKSRPWKLVRALDNTVNLYFAE